jgi:hypothetical protein
MGIYAANFNPLIVTKTVDRKGAHDFGFNIVSETATVIEVHDLMVGCIGKDEDGGFRFDTLDRNTAYAYSLQAQDENYLKMQAELVCNAVDAIRRAVGTRKTLDKMGEILLLCGLEQV